jgi:hypothetical protein
MAANRDDETWVVKDKRREARIVNTEKMDTGYAAIVLAVPESRGRAVTRKLLPGASGAVRLPTLASRPGLCVLRLPPGFVFELAARPARQAHSVQLGLRPRDHPSAWMRYSEIDPEVDVVARANDVRAIQAVPLRLSFNVRRDMTAIDPPAALRVLFERWPTSGEVDVDDDTIAWQVRERSRWRQPQDRVAVAHRRGLGLSLGALRG